MLQCETRVSGVEALRTCEPLRTRDPSSTYVEILHGTPGRLWTQCHETLGSVRSIQYSARPSGNARCLTWFLLYFFFALMHIRACGHPTLLLHASLCVIFLNPIRCWDRRNEITPEFRIASTFFFFFFSFESTACGTYGSSFFTTHQTEQHSSPGSNGWR